MAVGSSMDVSVSTGAVAGMSTGCASVGMGSSTGTGVGADVVTDMVVGVCDRASLWMSRGASAVGVVITPGPVCRAVGGAVNVGEGVGVIGVGVDRVISVGAMIWKRSKYTAPLASLALAHLYLSPGFVWTPLTRAVYVLPPLLPLVTRCRAMSSCEAVG